MTSITSFQLGGSPQNELESLKTAVVEKTDDTDQLIKKELGRDSGDTVSISLSGKNAASGISVARMDTAETSSGAAAGRDSGISSKSTILEESRKKAEESADSEGSSKNPVEKLQEQIRKLQEEIEQLKQEGASKEQIAAKEAELTALQSQLLDAMKKQNNAGSGGAAGGTGGTSAQSAGEIVSRMINA